MEHGFALGYFTTNLILPSRRTEIFDIESISQDHLEFLKGYGIRQLELGAYYDWEAKSADELKDLAQMITDMDMNLHSFHQSGFKTALNFPDSPDYQKDYDACLRQTEALAVFEPEIMVIHVTTPDTPASEVPEAELEAAGQGLNKIGEACMALGVKPAVENSPIVNSIEYNLRAIQYTDPKWIGLTIDAGHVHCVDADVTASVRQAGDRLIHLHIADNHGSEEGDVHLVPPDGTVDWQAMYQALLDINYGGVFMYELVHHPGRERVLDQVTKHFTDLKSSASG